MRHVWYLSVASVAVQLCVSLWLLQREFGRKLPPETTPLASEWVEEQS